MKTIGNGSTIITDKTAFPDYLVQMSDIKKTYDGKRFVLDGIDFKLKRGEIAIIMGPSGSGKSTFLNILGLLDNFTSGTYIFGGTDLYGKANKLSYSAIRGEKIGFIFQSYYLIDSLTVKDNIMMPFLYADAAIPADIDKQIEDYAGYFNLQGLIDKKASLLSGGERQRVAIIRAMIKKPSLIIADEPTGNLDRANGEIVINAFRKIAEEGTSIVLVTHNPDIDCPEGKRYCLNGGKLIESQ